MIFPINAASIERLVHRINPTAYARYRNFDNGWISYLGPYISRGYLSTKFIFKTFRSRGIPWHHSEKFIQELAWRDYAQIRWQHDSSLTLNELAPNQECDITIPKSIARSKTGIHSIDFHLKRFYTTGYLHNHMRMYIASIICNVAHYPWLTPAKWMHYHLLDADWGSNAYNWQWIAGEINNKKYYANQDNINRFFKDKQKGTFLDKDYAQLPTMPVPKALQEPKTWTAKTTYPQNTKLQLNPQYDTLVYTPYNLDPRWRNDHNYNRILFFDSSILNALPISEKSLNFILKLSQNIPGIQNFVGTAKELNERLNFRSVFYKEHPFNKGIEGHEDERDWLFDYHQYESSFFKFWKQCKKEAKWKGWIK